MLWVRRIRTVRPGDEVVIFGGVAGGDPAMTRRAAPASPDRAADRRQTDTRRGRRRFTVLDPADGTAIAEVALAGTADVDRAVAARGRRSRRPMGPDAVRRPRPDAVPHRRRAILAQAERLARLESRTSASR